MSGKNRLGANTTVKAASSGRSHGRSRTQRTTETVQQRISTPNDLGVALNQLRTLFADISAVASVDAGQGSRESGTRSENDFENQIPNSRQISRTDDSFSSEYVDLSSNERNIIITHRSSKSGKTRGSPFADGPGPRASGATTAVAAKEMEIQASSLGRGKKSKPQMSRQTTGSDEMNENTKTFYTATEDMTGDATRNMSGVEDPLLEYDEGGIDGLSKTALFEVVAAWNVLDGENTPPDGTLRSVCSDMTLTPVVPPSRVVHRPLTHNEMDNSTLNGLDSVSANWTAGTVPASPSHQEAVKLCMELIETEETAESAQITDIGDVFDRIPLSRRFLRRFHNGCLLSN